MPRLQHIALITLLALLPIRAELDAQYALGAGVSVPTGSFADAARPGWMVAGGYSPWRSSSGVLRLWLQGYYGENGADDVHQPNRQIIMSGVGLSLKPLPRAVNPSPYLIGAVGYLHHWIAGAGQGAMYLGIGAGTSVGRHWLQVRYQVAQFDEGSLGFLLVAAGTSF